MKKFWMVLLVLAMTVCGAIGIAACDKDKPDESQNQGQVEDKDKNDKDKNDKEETPGSGETEKPGTGSETTPGGSTDEGKDDEGNKGETNPPKNPEEEKPGQQTPPETKPEDPKEDEDDKGGEEQTPQNPSNPDDDEPQGDDPSAGGTEPGETTDPDKDNPGTGGETTDPGKDDPKPDTPKEDCEHVLTYTVVGTDRNTRQHIGKCSLCGKTFPAEKCTFGEPTKVNPTCTEDGYDCYLCTGCNIEYRAYGFIPGKGNKYQKLGHNMPEKWTHVEGTGYQISQHERKCQNPGCDHVETEACTFTGTFIAPTCDAPGKDERKCEKCNCSPNLLSSSLNKLEHDYIYTAVGNNQHEVRCANPCCADKVLRTEECTYDDGDKKDGTCSEDGVITYTCTLCGGTKTEKTTGHVYTNTNFCDKCGKDGLEYKFERYGFIDLNRIVYSSAIKNVNKIFIGTEVNGEKISAIDSDAFKDFNNLTEIFISKQIIAVGVDVFNGPKNLEKVHYMGPQATWEKLFPDGRMNGTLKSELHLPENVTMYYNADGEKIKKEWGITSENAVIETIALPAEGKRIYD